MALVHEVAAVGEFAALRRSPLFAGEGLPRGRGRHVVVVPGFFTTDAMLAPLRRWLTRLGYRARRADLVLSLACGERGLARLQRRVERIADEAGDRVALVCHSRGGHFGKVLAVRRPDLVRGVVTLGAPPLEPRAVHPVAAAPAVAVTLAGSAGLPGVLSVGCFRGACCAAFRRDLAGPVPASVGYVAVQSPTDDIVDRRFVPDDGAHRRDVRASHVGLIANADAYRVIAEALDDFDHHDTDHQEP